MGHIGSSINDPLLDYMDYAKQYSEADRDGFYYHAAPKDYRGIPTRPDEGPFEDQTLKLGVSLTVDILFNLISPIDLPLASWMMRPNFKYYNKKTGTYTDLFFAKNFYRDRRKQNYDDASVFKDYKAFRDFYMTPAMKSMYNNGLRGYADYKRWQSKQVQNEVALSILMAGTSILMGAATMGPAGVAAALAGIIIQESTTDSALRGLVESAIHDNHGVDFESDFKYYVDAIVESAYKRWLEDGFWVNGQITEEGETFIWLTANRAEYEKWLAEQKEKFAKTPTGNKDKPGTLEWAVANNRDDWIMRWAAKDLKTKYADLKKDSDVFNKQIRELRTKLPKDTVSALQPYISDYQAYRTLRDRVTSESNARVPGANLTTPWAGSGKPWEMDWLPSGLKLKGDQANWNPQITDDMAGAWKYHSIMNAAQLKDYFVKLQEGRFEEAWNQIDQIVYWSYGQVHRPEITKDVAKELGQFASKLGVQPPVAKILADAVQKLNLLQPHESPDSQLKRVQQVYQILLTMDFGRAMSPSDVYGQASHEWQQYVLATARFDLAAAEKHKAEADRLFAEYKRITESEIVSYKLPNGVELNAHDLNRPEVYGLTGENWTKLYLDTLAEQNLAPYLKDMYRWRLDYDNNYYVKPQAIDYSKIESQSLPAIQQPAVSASAVSNASGRFHAVNPAPATPSVTYNSTPTVRLAAPTAPVVTNGPS